MEHARLEAASQSANILPLIINRTWQLILKFHFNDKIPWEINTTPSLSNLKASLYLISKHSQLVCV